MADDLPTCTVFYANMQTALLDQIWIAASDNGICCLRFDEDSASFISHLAKRVITGEAPSIIHSEAETKCYQDAILAYLEEKTPIPESLRVDFHQLTSFQQQILEIVRRLPMGSTTTYGEIAEQIKNPNASRAIGQVLRRNPIPVIIPCHRVISSNGTLGGYGGVIGSKRKITLLKHEGVILA
ncbi:MAG: methylated-DNA--[protein]-cysteine S-methyltransferase [Anaerolineales bacterium]|nr:methylated-DNA--[protein]-cysteine S-methyltransferase [Anaerolineales bacterium]